MWAGHLLDSAIPHSREMVVDHAGRGWRGLGVNLIVGDDRLVGVLSGMCPINQPLPGTRRVEGVQLALAFRSSSPPIYQPRAIIDITERDVHDHSEKT